MNNPIRAGLLPLYLELYDQALPDLRKGLAPLLSRVAEGLTQEGLQVIQAPICRTKAEFARAVADLESQQAQCILTLHLAYSPSLESCDALLRTPLPIVICDTTLDYDFGAGTEPGRILYNHGIHGVQDMASVLRRHRKPFEIAAGHVTESHVLARTAGLVRAACAARTLSSMKVLRIGPSFPGMGDFAVPENVLREALGVRVDQISAADLADAASSLTRKDIDDEIAADRQRFVLAIDEPVHRRSVRVGLALRRALDKGGYGAFSMNFLAFDSPEEPIETVPFLEASKAMARGIGYAGEGDVLTAALVGALAKAFGDTTFTEIFCPDWKGNSLFLSHMGEINPVIAASQPLLCEKAFPWTPAKSPAVLACSPRQGPATFVNIAPGPDNSFGLIVAPVDVLPDTQHPQMRQQIRAWIRPRRPVADFLEAYSRHGGTHHSALVMGDVADAIAAFARFAGLECITL